MKIITINQFYFNKNFGDILKSNNNEIQDNKLGRRPYFLATKYNENIKYYFLSGLMAIELQICIHLVLKVFILIENIQLLIQQK